MDKVLRSGIQVNAVKEDTEVVHSSHDSATGSGSVKNEEVKKRMPQRMLKIQFKIITQKVMRKIENPVHTYNISERKRKSSAASDASTTLPKIRKKAKTDKDNSTQ